MSATQARSLDILREITERLAAVKADLLRVEAIAFSEETRLKSELEREKDKEHQQPSTEIQWEAVGSEEYEFLEGNYLFWVTPEGKGYRGGVDRRSHKHGGFLTLLEFDHEATAQLAMARVCQLFREYAADVAALAERLPQE